MRVSRTLVGARANWKKFCDESLPTRPQRAHDCANSSARQQGANAQAYATAQRGGASAAVVASAPNAVWTVDFKRWWRTQDGERKDPLTVLNGFSIYVTAARICKQDMKAVRTVFEGLFKRHGVPDAIQCDNGVPFISFRARAGLTSLSAWWISLGIRLFRSRLARPQDNGGHERMHRDMRADVQARARKTNMSNARSSGPSASAAPGHRRARPNCQSTPSSHRYSGSIQEFPNILISACCTRNCINCLVWPPSERGCFRSLTC
jgi:transposase InsO family protein